MNDLKKETKRITLAEARYLKHIGRINGPKVTIQIKDRFPFINIMDCQFASFQSALAYLQEDSKNVVFLEVVS